MKSMNLLKKKLFGRLIFIKNELTLCCIKWSRSHIFCQNFDLKTRIDHGKKSDERLVYESVDDKSLA